MLYDLTLFNVVAHAESDYEEENEYTFTVVATDIDEGVETAKQYMIDIEEISDFKIYSIIEAQHGITFNGDLWVDELCPKSTRKTKQTRDIEIDS